jgi:hypothetical protein
VLACAQISIFTGVNASARGRVFVYQHTHTRGVAHKHFIAQLGARNSLFRTRKFYSLRRTRTAATCGVVTSRIFSMPRSRLIFMARAKVSEKSTFYWRAAEIIVPPHTIYRLRGNRGAHTGCETQTRWVHERENCWRFSSRA